MYRALTRDIEVTVEPYYLADQSDPDDNRYVWGYRVVISNHSDLVVRLMTRYWHITDQNGQVDEVAGPGVIGEQPVLRPGDTYEYSSGCPLETPVRHHVRPLPHGGGQWRGLRRRHSRLLPRHARAGTSAELER